MEDQKRLELLEVVAAALRDNSVERAEEVASRIVSVFATITPPEYDTSMHMVMMKPGGEQARSVKPGNVRLNMGALVAAVANGGLTLLGATVTPWAFVLAAATIWFSLRSCMTSELDDPAASVLWTMWRNCDRSHTVDKSDLLALVNAERSRYGKSPLTDEILGRSVRTLRHAGCLDTWQRDSGRYWLREWVKVQYV